MLLEKSRTSPHTLHVAATSPSDLIEMTAAGPSSSGTLTGTRFIGFGRGAEQHGPALLQIQLPAFFTSSSLNAMDTSGEDGAIAESAHQAGVRPVSYEEAMNETGTDLIDTAEHPDTRGSIVGDGRPRWMKSTGSLYPFAGAGEVRRALGVAVVAFVLAALALVRTFLG